MKRKEEEIKSCISKVHTITCSHLHASKNICPPPSAGPYGKKIHELEEEIKAIASKVHAIAGVREAQLGLATPTLWDLVADKQAMAEEQALQVCTAVALHVL